MSDIKQPTESQEEQDSQSQTVHEKLDTLAEIVVANHQMLTAPPHHSPPPPPGGMPPVHPIQPAPQQQGTSGETVMTPAEYRAAHGE